MRGYVCATLQAPWCCQLNYSAHSRGPVPSRTLLRGGGQGTRQSEKTHS